MCILENITSMPDYMKNHSMGDVKMYFMKQVHGYSSFLKRLLLRMVDNNYKKRPTFDEVLCSNMEDAQYEKDKVKN